MKEIRLYPALHSKFSFSSGRLPDSDVLYSSLISSGLEVEDISISSAFPFVEIHGKVHRFLPLQTHQLWKLSNMLYGEMEKGPSSVDEYRFMKKLKSSIYFSEDFFRKTPSTIEEFMEKYMISGNIVMPARLHDELKSAGAGKIIMMQDEIHNSVCRMFSNTAFFSIKFLKFFVGSGIVAGMWFLTDAEFDKWDLLEYGGEIGMGAGKFDHFEESKPLSFDGGRNLLVSLSSNFIEDGKYVEKARIFYINGRTFVWKRLLLDHGHIVDEKTDGSVLRPSEEHEEISKAPEKKIIYGKSVYMEV